MYVGNCEMTEKVLAVKLEFVGKNGKREVIFVYAIWQWKISSIQLILSRKYSAFKRIANCIYSIDSYAKICPGYPVISSWLCINFMQSLVCESWKYL